MKYIRNKKTLLIFLLLLVASLVLRIYNFDERVTFGSEQARSLFVSGKYITEKPSLLGQEYFRVTSKGHKLFSGSLFSYSLVPLQLLFDFNPLLVTYFFAFFNVGTGALLYLLFKKLYGVKIALFSTLLFLFNDYMIYHSMFIWILNYLPLIGLLTFYFLFLFYKKQRNVYAAILGLLSGVGINFHYLLISIAGAVLLFVLYKAREKLKSAGLFLAGLFIGNITIFAFDLRHDFYHTRTLVQYGIDTLNSSGRSIISYYHFLHFWPVLALGGGYLLYKIWKKSRPLSFLIVFLYLLANLLSPRVDFKKPTGMPEGLLYKDVIAASGDIANDIDGDFNVVSLLDFDKRGYILRYPLEFMFGKIPMGVEDYPSATKLYALAKEGYNFDTNEVWELRVVKPYKVDLLSKIGEGYGVYRLTHEE